MTMPMIMPMPMIMITIGMEVQNLDLDQIENEAQHRDWQHQVRVYHVRNEESLRCFTKEEKGHDPDAG